MAKRWFSDQELAEMARPTMDRAIEALDRGDTDGARTLCEEMKHEWRYLHDLMAGGLLGLISFVQQRLGDDGVADFTGQCEAVLDEVKNDPHFTWDFFYDDPRARAVLWTVLVRIALDSQSEEALRSFEAGVAACPSITRCFLMSGADDYLAIVLAKDIEDFERIHRTELSRLPRVARIQSSFAIREIVDRAVPPVVLGPATKAGRKPR